jgi:hypothetical protein
MNRYHNIYHPYWEEGFRGTWSRVQGRQFGRKRTVSLRGNTDIYMRYGRRIISGNPVSGGGGCNPGPCFVFIVGVQVRMCRCIYRNEPDGFKL